MSLRQRLERLEERERRLLGILALVVTLLIVLFVPLGVTAILHTSRSENVGLREAIAELDSSRTAIEHSRAVKAALEDRYSRPAPPLSAFLSKLAGETEVEILESTDRQPVPHGKRFEEKSTQISLRKLGMYKIARFMERIEQSGHPVSITQLKIRKSGLEPDSFNVDMAVSAFERKPEKVTVKATNTPQGAGKEAP